MADLLESSSGRATQRTVARLSASASALREHLDEPARALAAYRNAIAIDPASKEARAGLTALLDVETTRAGAADALAQAMRINGDLSRRARSVAGSPRRGQGRPHAARAAPRGRAAPARAQARRGRRARRPRARVPARAARSADREPARRLAKPTGDYVTTRVRLPRGDHRARQRRPRGRAPAPGVRRSRRRSPRRSAERGRRATSRSPASSPAIAARSTRSRAAAASSAGGPTTAAVIVRYCAMREAFDDELLSILEVARGQDQLARRARLGARCRARQAQAAGRRRRAVRAPARVAPPRSLRRSAPARSRRCAAHSSSAAIAWRGSPTSSRSSASKACRRSCSRRCAGSPMPTARDLDSLVGAADVASKLGEREQALQILSAVLGRATAAWRGTAAIRSARSVDAVAKWAIDALVDLYRTGGRARAAVDTLIEAARLPFDAQTRRDMRLRAAQLATVELGDNAAAIEMYRSVLASSPNDLEVIERLAHLLGLEDRVPELLTLRQIQLGLETRTRIASSVLRLELAKLVGIVEERGGRLDALKANLEDRPGHDASIEAVARAARRPRASTAQLDRSARAAGPAARDRGRGAARREAVGALRAGRRARHQGDRARDQRPSPRRRARADERVAARARAPQHRARPVPGQAVPWLESLLGTVPQSERLLGRASSSRRRTCRRASPTARSRRSRPTSTTRSARARAAHDARRSLPQGRAAGSRSRAT